MAFTGFGPGAVRFYEELSADNSREWWHAHRDRYEAEVRAPLEHLLADLAGEFGEARVFRPQRDTRFSADKSPYKTTAAAAIHTAREVGSSLYVQLSADGLMTGAGLFHPARDQLAKLREAIADDRTGGELEDITARLGTARATIEAAGALVTAPRGYPKDHPRVELLRRKNHIVSTHLEPGPWLHSAEAKERITTVWRQITPLLRWLDKNART